MPTMSFQDFRAGIDRRKSQQIVDQAGLFDCKNAFINSGFAVKKRSGLDRISVSTLARTGGGLSSRGLFEYNQKLYVVSIDTNASQTVSGYGVGSGYPIDASVSTLCLLNPASVSDPIYAVWQFLVFNNLLYIVVEYNSGRICHHYGSASDMISATNLVITDTNCPNGRSAVVHDSKIYAIEPETNNPAYVKYSSTEDPTNWSKVKDASGLLGIPAGLEAMGNEYAIAVTSYRGYLAVFMQNSIQLWKTHPNPGLIELDTTVDNAFLEHHNSIAPISEDIFYLNSSGIHSVTQKVYTDTMGTSDVGSTISDLVKTSLTDMVWPVRPLALFYPGENQYILAIGKDMYVFTHSSKAGLNAWTRYVLPENINGITKYRNYLYVRAGTINGNENIYSFNPSSYQDQIIGASPGTWPSASGAAGTSNIDVEILSSYNSLGKPGAWKQIYGSDVMFTGTADLQHRWDSRSTSEETTAFELSGDSRPGTLIPVELMTTDISYKISNGKGPGRSDEDICNDKTGYHWDSTTNACVKDGEVTTPNGGDKTKKPGSEHTTEDACLKAGGRWVDGACQVYQKAPEYTPQPATPQQKTPESATSLLHKKQQASNPIAQTVADTFTKQVKGLGEKMYRLQEMDINRAQEEETLRQLQNDAHVGRSYSTSNMDAQSDIIREAAIRRMSAKDASEAKQAELDMMAAEQTQQVMLLSEQGKLAPGGVGAFTPGAISGFMPSGTNLGLGALPAEASLPTTWPGKESAAEAKAKGDNEEHTDGDGHKCKYGETDPNGYCPNNPKYTHPPEGAPEGPERDHDEGGYTGGDFSDGEGWE